VSNESNEFEIDLMSGEVSGDVNPAAQKQEKIEPKQQPQAAQEPEAEAVEPQSQSQAKGQTVEFIVVEQSNIAADEDDFVVVQPQAEEVKLVVEQPKSEKSAAKHIKAETAEFTIISEQPKTEKPVKAKDEEFIVVEQPKVEKEIIAEQPKTEKKVGAATIREMKQALALAQKEIEKALNELKELESKYE
jgi:hypothetical protein